MTGAPLGIAITCYPTYGGSGIIATELGQALARRGHQIHFVCSELPWRLSGCMNNITFHEVAARDYPLFEHDPYVLALASKLVEVATYHPIDVFHVHYAIPHATAALLAQQILGERAPRLMTTLHGTDITVVGNDRSFLPITRHSVERSNRVTVPSQFLASATRENLGLASDFPIAIIPNFVDSERYKPLDTPRVLRVIHNSNFRPVKRPLDVIEVFAKVRARCPAELLLIGDGPERSRCERRVHELDLASVVRFAGKQHDFVLPLQESRVFLQTSETESFGLAALEAQACGVPVVSTNVGGVAEVIVDGETGMLAPLGDIDTLAHATTKLLQDDALFARMADAARRRAVETFAMAEKVDQYEAGYRAMLDELRSARRG